MNRCETFRRFVDSPVMLQVLVAVAVLPLLCDPGAPLAQVTWSPWSPCTHSCEAGLQSRRLTACSDPGDMCQVRYRGVKQMEILDTKGRYSGNRFSQRLSSLCCFILLFLGQNSSKYWWDKGGCKMQVQEVWCVWWGLCMVGGGR